MRRQYCQSLTKQFEFTARQFEFGHIKVDHSPVHLDVEVEHEVGLGLAHAVPGVGQDG